MFKQKTAYEMRISDWSSDVCSSDLDGDGKAQPQHRLGGPSRLWTSGVGTVFTGRFRLEIDMPEAVAEQRERYACDIGLVRFERRQVGDPRAGNSEHKQQKRDDAASRGEQIGRATCRERGCQYVECWGGAGSLKNKHTQTNQQNNN